MPTRETRIAMDQLVAAAMEEDEEEDYEQAVVGRQPTWQETFQQLRDFHKLGRNKSPPPRLVRWMNSQRRRYKLYGVGRKKPVGIIKNRLNQLNSIGFDWSHGEETRNNRISDPLPSVSLPSSSLPIQQKNSRSSKASSKNSNLVMDKKKILNAGFPEQLFLMIQDGSKKCPHILDWHPDGSAFEIFDTKNVGNFISRYFRHGKVSSLRRMLHLYQFSTSNNVFRHPYFHRDMSLADLKRYVVKKPTP